MKIPSLCDYLLWKGKVAKIVCTSDKPTVTIEMLEDKKCPHCNESLGKEQIDVIVQSPLFQENAEALKTIRER